MSIAKAVFPETDHQSNKPAASGSDSSSDMRNALSALFQGDFAPLRPRAQDTPDLTVKVNPATVGLYYRQIYLGLNKVTYAGGNSSALSAPSANPRIDLLVLNDSGALEWITGDEAASPNEPVFPTDKIPICLVYCKTTMTKIVNYEDKDTNPDEAYILMDVRPLFCIPQVTL